LLVLALCFVAACGSDDGAGSKEKGQVVRFQKPTDPGPDPFTPKPADVRGEDRVQVGSGPYGGTGSDLVCDRELLIRSLRARPDRLREWARVVKVAPDYASVARYIRKLRPVTLTRDTRVTNHSFVGGRASGYQAILQAGTAVLVDEYGVPRARCRCGNPLLEPVYIPEATCYGCPPDYHPPPDCEPWDSCYEVYKHPPPVRGHSATTPSQPPPEQPQGGGQLNPQASFSPSSGGPRDPFTLHISGFSPNATVTFTIVRPDGGQDPTRTINTDGSGSGSYSFPPPSSDNLAGTYTATIRDPTGATTTATATVIGGDSGGGGGSNEPAPPDDGTGSDGSGQPPSGDGSGDGLS
jgi:uncharacterized protein DUF6777